FAMPMKTIRETAVELAKAHKEEDSQLVAVYWAKDDTEVRLVEGTEAGASSPQGDVLPCRFTVGSDECIIYPSVIVLLSRSEWEQVQKKALNLPPGWDVDSLEELKEIF